MRPLRLQEYIKNAREAFRNFLKLKPEERVLFLRDIKTDEKSAAVAEGAVKEIGSDLKTFYLQKTTTPEELKALLQECDVVIKMLEGDFRATDKLNNEYIREFGNRMVSFVDINPEAFRDGGPLTENLEELEFRLNKMEAALREAVGFRITSVYGTDLSVGLRPFKERRWYKDSGVINRKGQWDNLPGGEIFTVPDEGNVNGKLVLPVLDSELSGHQGVDEFVVLEIVNGRIASIRGGKSAERLQWQLKKDAMDEYRDNKDPMNVYQCAEISFGANSKARGSVADESRPYDYPGVSTVEAEKRFGTMHIAFGDTKLGEEGAEGKVEARVHYDFVIPRNGLTVEMFEHERDFEKKKNGRKIINEGGLNFF